MVCKSNLFKHFLKAIKEVELTTDSGNKFQTERIRLQKKYLKESCLDLCYISEPGYVYADCD